jgi:hypothetical protein
MNRPKYLDDQDVVIISYLPAWTYIFRGLGEQVRQDCVVEVRHLSPRGSDIFVHSKCCSVSGIEPLGHFSRNQSTK